MNNRRGQSMPEFMLIMVALAALGFYLVWNTLGDSGAMSKALTIATDKIAKD